jgi:hypothetical protein
MTICARAGIWAHTARKRDRGEGWRNSGRLATVTANDRLEPSHRHADELRINAMPTEAMRRDEKR